MLRLFRKKGVAKKILWGVAGIIIISFGFGFGMSRYGDALSPTAAAGKVFGKNVSIKDFQKYYRDTLDQAMLMHGDNYKKILPLINMDNETWVRIILVKEADQRHIKAADAEVIAFIATMPVFQDNGTFERARYNNIVRNVFQRESRDFEEGLRDQIKIMKMFHAETSGIRLSDEAIRAEYGRRNQKVQVSYVLVDPKRFAKDLTVDDKELQPYYDAHRENFLEPDAVNIQFMTVSLSDKPTDDEKAKARAKAQEIYQKLSSGGDFAQIAKAENLEATETGFFNMEAPKLDVNWSLELLQKVFSAKKGEILSPAETTAGIQILKLVDTKPAYIPEFAKAKDIVKENLLSQKASEIAKAKANEIHETLVQKLAAGQKFDATAKDLQLDAKTTPFFLLGDYIPEIGISEDFETAAFTLNKDNRLSQVVTTSRGPTIMFWEALEPIDEKKFEEVKKDFSATLADEQRTSIMNRIIKDAREKAGLESYLDKLKKK